MKRRVAAGCRIVLVQEILAAQEQRTALKKSLKTDRLGMVDGECTRVDREWRRKGFRARLVLHQAVVIRPVSIGETQVQNVLGFPMQRLPDAPGNVLVVVLVE